MSSQQIGNVRPSRRTLVKGAAWSVPVVAMAGPAPAFAASTPVDSPPADSPPADSPPVDSPPVLEARLGGACRFPGRSCEGYSDAVRFTFCFTNGSDESIQVVFPRVVVNGTERAPSPRAITVPAGAQNYCAYVFADQVGNSGNGQGTLYYEYSHGGEHVADQVGTGAGNTLPVCQDCSDVYGRAGAALEPEEAPSQEAAEDEPAPVEETTVTDQAPAEGTAPVEGMADAEQPPVEEAATSDQTPAQDVPGAPDAQAPAATDGDR